MELVASLWNGCMAAASPSKAQHIKKRKEKKGEMLTFHYLIINLIDRCGLIYLELMA